MITRPLVLLALLFGRAAFGAEPQATPGPVKPPWIATLPNQAGRVYAMGMAPFAPSEVQAILQASSHARTEVLTRLRANVKAETRVSSQSTVSREGGGRTTGSSRQEVGQTTNIRAQATDLPGLVVEATWVDAEGGAAYALAYLDVPLAEQAFRSRFMALQDDLGQASGTPAEPRERMRKLNHLKGAQVELAKLDDGAALLLAGGGDPGLRSRILNAKWAVDRQMEQLRASLTLSLEGGARQATQIAGILRNAALKAGLGWTEGDGEFRLALDYRADDQGVGAGLQRPTWNGWWRSGWVSRTESKDTGIIVARGALEITLKDKAGNAYESMEIEAKGVGVSDFQAEQRLKDDFRAKLEKTFNRWLENLVN